MNVRRFSCKCLWRIYRVVLRSATVELLWEIRVPIRSLALRLSIVPGTLTICVIPFFGTKDTGKRKQRLPSRQAGDSLGHTASTAVDTLSMTTATTSSAATDYSSRMVEVWRVGTIESVWTIMAKRKPERVRRIPRIPIR